MTELAATHRPVVLQRQAPQTQTVGKDGGSPAHAVHRRNSLTSSEQEELRSLRQRFRDTALWSLLAKQEDAVPQISVPVPFDKETDEVILPVTAERTSECTVEQIVDMAVPQIQEQIVEVAQTIPQERTSEHTAQQIAGVPVPWVQERILEGAKIIPQKRILERIVGQMDDVPVPQTLNEIVEVGKAIPRRVFLGGFVNRSFRHLRFKREGHEDEEIMGTSITYSSTGRSRNRKTSHRKIENLHERADVSHVLHEVPPHTHLPANQPQTRLEELRLSS